MVAVTDGDTIRVLLQGQEYPVRYIGIDTPEAGQRNTTAARDQNAALVSGKTVRLEKDVSDTDRYGRLLRYVWVGDIMVDAELVRQGYAQAATFPPDVKYQKKFSALQKEAQTAGRGLWRHRAATAPNVANLRGGPGTNYQIVGGVKAGDALKHCGPECQGRLVSACERGVVRGVISSECTGWRTCGGHDPDHRRQGRRRSLLRRRQSAPHRQRRRNSVIRATRTCVSRPFPMILIARKCHSASFG